MSEIVRHASTQYGDWRGTVAADEHMTIGHPKLRELVGLDDSWWIVGIDIVATDYFYVYAIENTTGITKWDELQLHATANGALPVVSFMVHDMSPAVLLAAFTDWQVQLRSRILEGAELDVVDKRDLNYSKGLEPDSRARRRSQGLKDHDRVPVGHGAPLKLARPLLRLPTRADGRGYSPCMMNYAQDRGGTEYYNHIRFIR